MRGEGDPHPDWTASAQGCPRTAVATSVGSLQAPDIVDTAPADTRLAGAIATLRNGVLARLKANALDLPLLPQVAMQVLAMASREDADAHRLAELLRRDQAMTVHVLRVVNSPFYRSRSPIESLEQATMRLGFPRVRQIALVIACKQRIFRVKGFEPEVYKAFRHSLATALFAEELARALGRDEGEAFLAGLLHDVGRPIVLQAVADFHPESRLTNAPAVLAVAAELHTRVGGVLARKWHLPASICDAITYHHNPTSCPSVNQLPMLVNLADDLAVGALEANDATEPAPPTHWTLPHLHLPHDALAKVLAQRDVLLQTMQAVA